MKIENALLLDREQMTEDEKLLLLSDMKKVCEEYFECCENFSLDIAKAEQSFSICLIFNSRRIKQFKHPK
jgi:hypothetical protein